jgi:protein-L-isoaspartate(D-aspartate) O-methyltransferase
MTVRFIVRSVKSSLMLILLLVLTVAVSAQDFRELRESMVSRQIEARGVSDVRVLEAMRTVERHKFVDPGQAGEAYADRPLPIGHGQTISQPYIVAYMTEAARPRSGMKALEIGTGSGYQAAVLSEIVDSVFTIEIIEPLARSASARLDRLGFDNVETRHADGYWGWEEHAPFDIIVVTAASEQIPPPLIKQLKDGGRMIIPVGSAFWTQTLVLVRKDDGRVRTQNLLPVRFVPFTRSESD